MSDDNSFELPKATDKLSYKFILDSVKDRMFKSQIIEEVTQEPPHEEHVEEQLAPASEAEVSAPRAEAQCGGQAELPLANEIPIESGSTEPLKPLALEPGKKYFRIGEVSEVVGVEPYVLRYWESEFSSIRPIKSSSGHRVYSRKDVETLYLIRHLLHVEKFSIKGAKKRLHDRKKEVVQVQAVNTVPLKEIASEIKELIHLIRQPY